MKKILSIFIFLFFISLLTGCDTQTVDEQNNVEALEINKQSADKLEVYYFHRNARCYSCETIGKYVKETIEQEYGEQVKNGKIDFKELNVDLPENKEIAKKYQASGSSLFINRIIDGQDNIEQDTDVWQLLGDEIKFKAHIKNKINSYLGT